MIPITLCFAIFAACFALNQGQLSGGAGDLPSVNFSDFPPPVPNAPDLQKAGLYQSRNSLGSNGGRLSDALANQNMIMEPSGGMEFGLGTQNSGFGRQTGLGMNSGFSQNPSSMGSLGGTDFGSVGSVDNGMGALSMGSVDNGMGSMGMGGMDPNSGFGNPSGSFGEIPSSGLDQGMGLSNNAGQISGQGAVMPSADPYQQNSNFYMTRPSPVVPGARGMTRNFSRRPMPVMRPPPIILLPPPQRRPFSLFQRRPRVTLVPLGPPMTVPFPPGQF